MEYIRKTLHVVCVVCLHRVRGKYELCHRFRFLRRIWVQWIRRGQSPRVYMNLWVSDWFLGQLSQSRVIWVISGSKGLYRGIFHHFRKFVCLGSLGVRGHRKWGKSTLRPTAVPTVPKPFLYLKWLSSYKGSKLGVLLFT